MKQKRYIYIALGLLAGAVLGAILSDTIKSLGLYSGLGAIVGICLGWLVATAVKQRNHTPSR